MKTVNLQLAIQLKEAGYPQESEFYWTCPEGKENYAHLLRGKIPDENNELYIASKNKSFASPTADEILELLPVCVDLFRNGNIPLQYCARYYPDMVAIAIGKNEFDKNQMDKGRVLFFQELSLADTAAKMWLYLKKEKLLA